MKKALILLLLMFIVACDQTTITSSITRTQTTINETTETIETTESSTDTVSQVIYNPMLSRLGNEIYCEEVLGATEYAFTVKDITYDLIGLTTENPFNYLIYSDTPSFNLSTLEDNRTYEISVSVDLSYLINDTEAFVLEYYSGTADIDVSYNVNNGYGLYLEVLSESTVYYYRYSDTLIRNEYNSVGTPILAHGFISVFTNDIVVKAYTSTGIYTVMVSIEDITKPYIISDNEVTFAGEDLVFVFDLCEGELVDINGSLLSTSDYTFNDNILVINQEFIQNLFDAEPQRDTVILAYQLRNDTDIVIGYLFIQRETTN